MSYRIRTRLATAATALLCAVPCAAQAASELHFERIGAPAGPPPEVITSLLQDREGLIWIASRSGLFLFDGYTYTTFQHDPSDPRSLSDSDIRTIYADPDGALWVGTNTAGLNRFDPATGTFTHYRHGSADPGSLSHDSVYAILRDRAGRLWVGTQRGLNRLDPGSKSFVRMTAGGREGLANDYIMALCEDRGGRLWVGTLGGGVHRWDESLRRFDVFRNDPSDARSIVDDAIASLAEDDAGRLWIGTLHGLSRLDVDRKTFLNLRAEPGRAGALQIPLVTSIARGDPGRLWIGTLPGALAEIDAPTGRILSWQRLPGRPYSPSEDAVYALLRDRDGALWVGTWGAGLNRVSRASQRLAGPGSAGFPPEGVPARDVTTILNDRTGRIWIGTRSGYLVKLDPASGRYETILRGGREGTARILIDLAEDRLGRVWVASNGGLLRVNPDGGALTKWSHEPGDPDGLGPGYVTALLVDAGGALWVGTGEGGLHKLDGDGKVVARYKHDAADPFSLSDDYVTVLREDRRGALWIGTRSGGLNAFDPRTGRVRRFLPVAGDLTSLAHHCVTSLLEDSKGRLWVGTAGGGLNRVDRAEDGRIAFDRINEERGLIDDDVTAIVEDDDGSLWVTTRRGLSRFHPDRNAFSNVFVSDGLPSAEFEPHSAARSRDTLYFGTVRGLAALPAATPFEKAPASPVVVRSIRTAGDEASGAREAKAPQRVELPFGTWLSVELAVLDYAPEQSHLYAYSLGDEWVQIGQRREITFTSLQPGKHDLRLRGRNSQGVWSETAEALPITVVPPFWMTRTFQVVMIGALVSVIWGAHRRRTSTLEKRNRELMELHRQREKARQDLDAAYHRLRRLTLRLEVAKEDERQRIARELHDEMGPSLTAVIINLQLLSSHRDGHELNRRIADSIDLVDRMVQRVRDISFDLRPPLIDELGLVPALSGYLEQVSERTGIRIEMKSDAEPGPLPAHVPITAFRVVQEAVTNAVRYAGASRIDVTVRRNGKRLDLRVEDDGKGFDVAETMEGAAAGKALGLLGMRERVGMLSGDIEIDSKPAKGTRIHVELPIAEAP